jgi:hypothetical protein
LVLPNYVSRPSSSARRRQRCLSSHPAQGHP